jgi:hypothetical protein
MRIVEPAAGARITVPGSAVWPAVTVWTDATGPHVWRWAIQWETFSSSGTVNTPDNVFRARCSARARCCAIRAAP